MGEENFAMVDFKPEPWGLGDVFSESFAGTCDECHIYADVTFHFSLRMSDNEIQEMGAYVEGALAANINVSSLKPGSMWNYEALLATYRSPEVRIPFGSGTVFLRAEVPITMRLEGEALGDLEVQGG